jgi:hypothetical protein
LGKNFLLREDFKGFNVTLWRAKSLTGNDMIADIQTTFNGDLKKVLGAFNLCEIGQKFFERKRP